MGALRRIHKTSQFSQWLGFQMWVEPDDTVFTRLALQAEQGGPPGHVHGGVLASLLDEVMGAAVMVRGRKILAANLNINYRQPVPLGVEILVRGHWERAEGRKHYARGAIYLPDGSIATEGTGLFVEGARIIADLSADSFFSVENVGD